MRVFLFLIFAFFSVQNSNAQINTTSVLAEGTIVKIPVTQTGVYKLDFNYLKEAGLAIEGADPRNISIYGNGGGMMQELIDVDYKNTELDLVENAIFVSGESDGTFNSGDFILFYGEGATLPIYNPNTEKFTKPLNRFDTKNYYFIKIGNTRGKRVTSTASANGATYTSTEFDDVVRFEKDEKNLLNDWVDGQGSGQHWYGDQFKNTRERIYDSQLNFPNRVASEPIECVVRMVARARESSSKFLVEINGESFPSTNFSRSGYSAVDTYCHARTVTANPTLLGDNIEVKVSYPNTSFESEAWLDYIEINAVRQLKMTGDQMGFRDFETTNHVVSEFKMSEANGNLEIWNVTDPTSVEKQEGNLSGGNFTFSAATEGGLQEFFVFNKNQGFLTPGEAILVPNQNVHATPAAELAILYHPEFEEQVMRLAEHRRVHNGYDVVTIPVEQVLNEFSSGRFDPVGIRDFSKMMFDRYPGKYRFLLLFGDGSYDSRNINGDGNNFVPIYETKESHNPINAYPADDYYALLTPGEGFGLGGDLDIAVGRFPVNSLEEAETIVDKLIKYDTDPISMRDWRNRFTFVSDDDSDGDKFDGNWRHVRPSEQHANTLDTEFPNFNVDKIYLDAYPQIATSGGQKYPAVNDAIDRTIFKGVLGINYFGHGGSKGWAQERVLKIENILSWENEDRLPLFITATCSFTGYDAPTFKSAGEEVFLSAKGGAFALFSTTRAVYINDNEELVTAVFDTIFDKRNGEYGTIGEILAWSKNGSRATDTNSRKFCLIGDPSMNLALPKYNVATTMINGHDVSDGVADTLKALQEVTIEGMITDSNGEVMTGFNGSVYPTIFDKKTMQTTLGNDARNEIRDFELQKSILFKGKATVRAGQFSFTFVVPKDINYDYGPGKISYYAEDGINRDAAGSYRNIIIGQTSENALNDNDGPIVEVFMNNEDFILGGMTSANPVIFVKLTDDTGINVAGTSIGHDLTAILDNNTQEVFVMNDFYESELNNYRQGFVKYPLSNLTEGLHRVDVTAWDVSNNFGVGFTEFIVANSEEVALINVFNFPNPFVDQTCISFETNLANEELDVKIDIFGVNGQLVKIIETTMTPTGYRLGQGECIPWDGTSDSGLPLGKGVYVYRVKISGTGTNGFEQTSEFEKMVVLK